MNDISQFLQERIDANDFPSAVYLVAEKGKIVFHEALGYAVVEPKRIKATLNTIYDIASLTKPLVVGLLCAKLIQNGALELDQTAEHYLPELIEYNENAARTLAAEYDNLDVSVGELLTHRTTYQAWKPFYLLIERSEDVRRKILFQIANRIPPQQEPEVIYSDLNFIMLAGIIEKLYGRSIDEIADQEIFQTLGLHSTCFNPKKDRLQVIAASEKGNEYEKNTCIETGYLKADPGERDPRFRDHQIWGEVHDGNAWFMGGVSGHAGLFSTAEETFRIALQFLPNYSTLLDPETCELFRKNFTAGMSEDRSLAFQLASTKDSTAGTKMSPESFGHLGFTGTSLWIDPVKERIFVLLTNRTHAHPLPFVNINSVRRRFHDLAIDLLDKKLSN